MIDKTSYEFTTDGVVDCVVDMLKEHNPAQFEQNLGLTKIPLGEEIQLWLRELIKKQIPDANTKIGHGEYKGKFYGNAHFDQLVSECFNTLVKSFGDSPRAIEHAYWRYETKLIIDQLPKMPEQPIISVSPRKMIAKWSIDYNLEENSDE